MSNLVFVRHGQASLFSDDYDNLSPVGEQQSSEVGRYFDRRGVEFDEVYIGPRRRHRQTADHARSTCRSLADAEEIAEFDEHHVDQLVSRHLDELCGLFPDLIQLRDNFHSAETPIERQRGFARLFEAVSDLWVQDACPSFGIETWVAFRQRVSDGIDRIVSRSGGGRNVLVAASAGTVVAAVHKAVQCPANVAMGLGWRVWNCSLTGFAFSHNRFTLDHFNTMAHLEDRALWTYR